MEGESQQVAIAGRAGGQRPALGRRKAWSSVRTGGCWTDGRGHFQQSCCFRWRSETRGAIRPPVGRPLHAS